MQKNLPLLADNPMMPSELSELLQYTPNDIDSIAQSSVLPYVCPLDVHCTYSRDQLFATLGFLKPRTMREGFKYLKKINIGVVLITLNKSDKDYSLTTLYNDCDIISILFHCQSQSTTSAESATDPR